MNDYLLFLRILKHKHIFASAFIAVNAKINVFSSTLIEKTCIIDKKWKENAAMSSMVGVNTGYWKGQTANFYICSTDSFSSGRTYDINELIQGSLGYLGIGRGRRRRGNRAGKRFKNVVVDDSNLNHNNRRATPLLLLHFVPLPSSKNRQNGRINLSHVVQPIAVQRSC